MLFEKLNSKVVSVDLQADAAVLARRGSMLGCSGEVSFTPVSNGAWNVSGMAGMLGRALKGENQPLMSAQGAGKVLYGRDGLEVHIYNLAGESMWVEASRLLVYDASLSTSQISISTGGMGQGVMRAVGGSQGLYTTLVQGQGSVAVLSDGEVFALTVSGGADVVVDPQAYIAHVGNLDSKIKSSHGWRDAVGRGSGEGFQMQFTGEGSVFVQPSEVVL